MFAVSASTISRASAATAAATSAGRLGLTVFSSAKTMPEQIGNRRQVIGEKHTLVCVAGGEDFIVLGVAQEATSPLGNVLRRKPRGRLAQRADAGLGNVNVP